MSLVEVNAIISRLQPQFDAELAAYRTAVRSGDRVAASEALERLRPLGDRLQAAHTQRVNLERRQV